MATTVRLGFSPEELNLVLVALAKLPYAQVHELIAAIQTEAGPQLLAAVRSANREGIEEEDPTR